MCYEGLIDTVSDIVKTYGVGILSDSKFWNILTDTYSFVGEYSLKDSFKDFLSNGNIKELKLKERRKETLKRTQITEYDVRYISETLLSKLRKECSDGIRESQIENKRKEKAARRQIEQEEILRKEQIRKDSIQRAKNHENAINEI